MPYALKSLSVVRTQEVLDFFLNNRNNLYNTLYNENMEKNIQFLAIGDMVTDNFIELKDAEAICDIDKQNCKLCVNLFYF